jgi:hypothetical protein
MSGSVEGRNGAVWTTVGLPGSRPLFPQGASDRQSGSPTGALLSHCGLAEVQLLVSNIDDAVMLEEEIGAQ